MLDIPPRVITLILFLNNMYFSTYLLLDAVVDKHMFAMKQGVHEACETYNGIVINISRTF